jgi:hypothetical protein
MAGCNRTPAVDRALSDLRDPMGDRRRHASEGHAYLEPEAAILWAIPA